MDGKLRNMTSIFLYDHNKMLMLYRIDSRAIKDSYIGTAGGHFENNELNDAKKCVLRELQEEVNLTSNDISDLALKYVTLRYKNDEIRQNYYFFARLTNTKKELKSNEGNLKWFHHEDIPLSDMPHTARYVIEHYLNEGRFNTKLYAGIAVKNGVQFTQLESFE